MKKMWLVVKHDYQQIVRQKGFLIALFSLPLFIGLSYGLGLLMRSQEESSNSIGYLDQSGVLDNPLSLGSVSKDEHVEILEITEINEADEMLKLGSIQAYFLIPEEYPEDKNIEIYYYDRPKENAVRDFYDFLQLNLMRGYPLEIRNRVALGTTSIIRTPDGSREFPDNNPTMNTFLPLIIGLGFIMLLLISSGYLMSGFLDEKSNRTIELIFTSLPTSQLILSKLITMIAVGLTMLTTWIAIGVLAVVIGANFLDLNWVRDISLDWKMLGTILMVALPSYVFAAALMLGIGLLLGNSQEAESIGPLFFMAAFIPLWFIVPITQDLNGPIAVLLSLLPISSILTIGLRGIFIEIPTWQLLLSFSIQLGLITAALWFAVRTFQIGLLRTGGRISWNELFSRNRRKVVEERE